MTCGTFLRVELNVMKTLVAIALFVLALQPPLSAFAGDAKKKKSVSHTFLISGMKCEGCAAGLKFELDEIKAIKSTKIDFDKKLAVIAYSTNKLPTVELLKTIKELGYQAKLQPKKAPEPKDK